MKFRIKQVFVLFLIMFAVLAANVIKLVFFDADVLAANSYNKRLSANYDSDKEIRRGDIIANDEEVLVFSEEVYGGGYMRKYVFPEAFCHITGFSGLGKAGIELKYNFSLQRQTGEIWQRVKNVFTSEPLLSDSAVLTVDAGLQQLAYQKLKDSGHNGGVAVLDAGTGAVMALCSVPAYDPNETAYEWGNLLENTETPLLSRAAQGLYPPGSTFKIITAAAILENYADYEVSVYNCTGEAVINGDTVRCFNSTAHGEVDLKQALTVSCNCYFASMSDKIDVATLRKTAEGFMFNNSIQYPLEYSVSLFSADANSGNKELIDTYYGQGKTIASPLMMALCAGAVANGGVMMKPYVLDYIKTYSGAEKDRTKPKQLKQAILPETAEILKGMMVNVVNEGTGRAAAIDGLVIGGKTGTAQNSGSADHSWFIGFMDTGDTGDTESRTIAVAVLLENTGGGSKAVEIAGEIFGYFAQ